LNRKSKFILTLVLALVLSLSVPLMALAGAYVEGENITEEISFYEFVECAAGGAGEIVYVSGTLHYMWHATDDANGGVHLTMISHPMGVTGVGQTTGDVYRGVGALKEQVNYGNIGETYSFAWIYMLVGPGNGNNIYLHENQHVTVNANGELTSDVDNYFAGCK
jgi:hypothetical protein